MANKNGKPENLTRKAMGRPVGSTNKVTRVMKDALLIAAIEIGDVGMYIDTKKVTTQEQRGELVGFLKWVALNDLKTFCSMLGRLIPMHVTGSLDLNETKTYATKEELIEEMKRRGLPVSPVFSKTLPKPTHEEPENETSH